MSGISEAGPSGINLLGVVAFDLTVAVMVYTIGPISGTAVNPARSLGSAVFAQGIALSQLWLFIVAPIAGGLFAAMVRKIFIDD